MPTKTVNVIPDKKVTSKDETKVINTKVLSKTTTINKIASSKTKTITRTVALDKNKPEPKIKLKNLYI